MIIETGRLSCRSNSSKAHQKHSNDQRMSKKIARPSCTHAEVKTTVQFAINLTSDMWCAHDLLQRPSDSLVLVNPIRPLSESSSIICTSYDASSSSHEPPSFRSCSPLIAQCKPPNHNESSLRIIFCIVHILSALSRPLS